MTSAAAPSSSARALRIGIVGFGTFGQFLSKTMIKQGHLLSATSRSDSSQVCRELGVPFYRILSEMDVETTPLDTKGFEKLVEVKESTVKNSFDLFSGLFIHNRFARLQMQSLEEALEKTKQKLQERLVEHTRSQGTES
ncbi:unnamed protein product [Cuscuta epithymum]|uniref:TYRAAT2-like C-terminal domain-containing protein n=1 Tax=Cuscuta epithymum TaxID=186058 RepID=A0AAV0FWU9_9ASTE|nr:unnamed protein product [Cuscuta epithymum]